MLMNVISDRVVWSYRRRQDECELILAKDITRPVFGSGLRSRIGKALKAKYRFVIVRSLFGIPDVEFHIISPLKWQKIDFGRGPGFWSSNGCFHGDIWLSDNHMLTHREQGFNGERLPLGCEVLAALRGCQRRVL